jgi:hypothetical protein
MVQDRAIERVGGGGEPFCCMEIRIARPRVAARVIVSQDDSRAAMDRGIDDNPA